MAISEERTKIKIMSDYKTCGSCKKEYPKTEEYFFVRNMKQKISIWENCNIQRL